MSGYSKCLLVVVVMVLGVFVVLGKKPVKLQDDEIKWSGLRSAMMVTVRRYGVKDELVLEAMARVRRHMFIPEGRRWVLDPYADQPCPIGYGQTISQPFIVAYMTVQLHITKGAQVLEIGTGSGYQAAVLAELGADVYSVEIVPELAEHARAALKGEGYESVKVLTGDGYKGWPEHAPYDAIIVTCAPTDVPKALILQLKDGGRMIIPVGTQRQRLVIMRKKSGKIHQEADIAVRFVPMVKGK